MVNPATAVSYPPHLLSTFGHNPTLSLSNSIGMGTSGAGGGGATTPTRSSGVNLPAGTIAPGTTAAVAALQAAVAASAGLPTNVKDSRWLTLEVCRQFQRNKCSRDENECKFAHPPTHVDVQNGRVICCYDSIKGKCQRRDPPCKYLHPPQHLREQLMQNGRNNMIMKNMQFQLFQQHLFSQAGVLPLSTTTLNGTGSSGTHGCPPTAMNPPLLYPGPSALNMSNPNAATAYSLLGLTPYLNAVAATGAQVNPGLLASFNGATNGTCEVVPPSTPAKRPAIADAKSGLPVYGAAATNVQSSTGGAENGGTLMLLNGTHPVDSQSNPATSSNNSGVGTTVNNMAVAAAALYTLHQQQQQQLTQSHHSGTSLAPHHLTSAPLASLAAINGVNGTANGAVAPYTTVADPTAAYFHPAFHVDIQQYMY